MVQTGRSMVEQVFHVADLKAILLLIVLEGLLSADNALVLAIMVRHLPSKEQRKALLYGLGGAFVFRFVAILLATLIIQLWWLQLVGAVYLAWITIKHFAAARKANDAGPDAKKLVGKGFWATVVAVELTDIAFAVDSVVAAVAVEPRPEKIWVVYSGAIFGVVLLRFAAGAFIRLLDKYPIFEHLAYALIGWVAIKLGMMSLHNFTITPYGKETGLRVSEMPHLVFWAVMGVMIVGGTMLAISAAKQNEAESEAVESAPTDGEES